MPMFEPTDANHCARLNNSIRPQSYCKAACKKKKKNCFGKLFTDAFLFLAHCAKINEELKKTVVPRLNILNEMIHKMTSRQQEE